jgi:hypothetical protein
VKKKRHSTYGGASTTGSSTSNNMKTFYPPNYDKVNHHMEKFPKIKRFNEEYETVSNVGSVKAKSQVSSAIKVNMKPLENAN